MIRRILAVALILVVSAGALAACGSDSKKSTTKKKTSTITTTDNGVVVNVTLGEMFIKPGINEIKTDRITFSVKNTGAVAHEFVIVKAPKSGKLAVADGKASYKEDEGELPVIKPKETQQITVDLKPGKYFLICNYSGHYSAGMTAAFRVL